jgi:hypothetical protein
MRQTGALGSGGENVNELIGPLGKQIDVFLDLNRGPSSYV